MKTALVTDSTSDIPAEVAAAHQIEVVPNLLMIENQTYIDGKGISREDFYARLPSFTTLPTTAAPSISVYQETYERLLSCGYAQVISIHASAALSAIHNIASIAARSFAGRVHVVDSMQVSLGLGFQVISAAEAAAKGAMIGEITDLLDRLKERVRVVALLDTLEYVRHSGRVHWITATLGSKLGLKALIEVRKGIVQRLGLSRTRSQGLDQLRRLLAQQGPLERLAILHTSITNPGDIQSLLSSAIQVAHEPMVQPITTVVGTHVGPNGLGFAAVLN